MRFSHSSCPFIRLHSSHTKTRFTIQRRKQVIIASAASRASKNKHFHAKKNMQKSPLFVAAPIGLIQLDVSKTPLSLPFNFSTLPPEQQSTVNCINVFFAW